MGRPKALLPFGSSGTTFVARVVQSLRAAGLDDILVIGRPDDRALHDIISSDLQARYVANRAHDKGQLSSIVAAVDAVDRPGARGLLVVPVDMPLVEPATFAAVLVAWEGEPDAIVRAVCGGRHGHPVIFPRATFDRLRHADPAIGAKSVLRAPGVRIVNVDVPDTGAITDVDSLDDYVAIFGRPPDGDEA